MTSEKLMPLNAASGDQFGNSIFIFENYAIIGALKDSTQNQEDPTGCAYIFKKTDGHWNQTCKLLPPPGDQRDRFAWSVSMTNEYAIVSSFNVHNIQNQFDGKAYLYKNQGNDEFALMTTLRPLDGISSSQFGFPVSISGDIAVVGAPYNSLDGQPGVGSVYIYYRDGATWIQRQKLVGESGERLDLFGSNLCLSKDKLVVGVPGDNINGLSNQGSVYYFHLKDFGVTRQIKIVAQDGLANASFGSSVDIKNNRIIIGAPGDLIEGHLRQGSAYIYEIRNDEIFFLKKLKAFDGEALDDFGEGVSIDKNLAIVSIPRKSVAGIQTHGKVYVYRKFLWWWIRIRTLTDLNPEVGISMIKTISLYSNTIGFGLPHFRMLQGKTIMVEL